jgi:hypothetical protein
LAIDGKKGMKMKGREKEDHNQIQLIKYEPNQYQPTPNRREIKITGQEVSHIFFVFFELK